MPGLGPRLSGSAKWVVLPVDQDSQESSCPCLSRASTCSFAAEERVDGRNKSGHDDKGESACDPRLSSAVSRCEPDSGGLVTGMTKIESDSSSSERALE